MTTSMKHSEAVKLNSDGKLKKRVMTEKGWYTPHLKEAPDDAPNEALPAVFRRKPGRPKKAEII